MTKTIGIPTWVGSGMIGCKVSYIEFLRKFGNVVLLQPDEIDLNIDILILPGGADISPDKHENSLLSLHTKASNPMLEYFDTHCLPEYIKADIPIIGICRGAQKLWSTFGGHILQHVDDHTQSTYDEDDCHQLEYLDTSYIPEDKNSWVNSRHHQTMSYQDCPDILHPIALAVDMDGKKKIIRTDIVEIFKVKNKSIYGLQFHPEDLQNSSIFYKILNNIYNDNNK